MQLKPKFSHVLFIVETDDGTFHFPANEDGLLLEHKGVDTSAVYTAACGASGKAYRYGRDEYTFDVDSWCPECVEAIEERRRVIAMMKDPATLDAALAGFKSDVPVHIVRTPLSKSRDLI